MNIGYYFFKLKGDDFISQRMLQSSIFKMEDFFWKVPFLVKIKLTGFDLKR